MIWNLEWNIFFFRRPFSIFFFDQYCNLICTEYTWLYFAFVYLLNTSKRVHYDHWMLLRKTVTRSHLHKRLIISPFSRKELLKNEVFAWMGWLLVACPNHRGASLADFFVFLFFNQDIFKKFWSSHFPKIVGLKCFCIGRLVFQKVDLVTQ